MIISTIAGNFVGRIGSTKDTGGRLWLCYHNEEQIAMPINQGQKFVAGAAYGALVTIMPLISLAVGCGSSSADAKKQRRVREEYTTAFYRDERPIHLAIKMVDQDGRPAERYEFKIALTRLHTLLWLFSWTADECYHLTTNDEGLALLDKPGRKAGLALLREVSTARYVFSKSLRGMGTVPMPKLTDVPQPIQLKVIRHDPPPKLLQFSTPYKEFPAEAVNILAFDPASPVALAAPAGGMTVGIHSIGDVTPEGELLIRVDNARMASAEEMVFMGWSKAPPSATPVEWSVTLHGNGRFLLHETDDDYVSYAPTDGYTDSLSWKMRVEGNEGAGISKFVYVRDSASGTYFWLNIAIGLRNNNKMDVHLEGCTNPDGSNNLYRDVWPDKEEFERYSRRCP
jgi:hypothetical protein